MAEEDLLSSDELLRVAEYVFCGAQVWAVAGKDPKRREESPVARAESCKRQGGVAAASRILEMAEEGILCRDERWKRKWKSCCGAPGLSDGGQGVYGGALGIGSRAGFLRVAKSWEITAEELPAARRILKVLEAVLL